VFSKKKPEVLHKSKEPPNNGMCILYPQNTYSKTKKMVVIKEGSSNQSIMGHGEPAPTSAPSTGFPLLLSCG